MIMIEHLFCNCQFVLLSKPYVPVVLLYSCLHGRLNCPIYTWPHSHRMLYTPTILSSRSSFTGWKKLEIILGGRPTLLMCLTNVLLRCSYVAWTHGRTATKAGFSLDLEVLNIGLRTHHICLKFNHFLLKWS